MSPTGCARTRSMFRGRPLHIFEYMVRHQIGHTLYDLEVTVHVCIDPASGLYSQPGARLRPIYQVLRSVPDFSSVFDLYQHLEMTFGRSVLTTGYFGHVDADLQCLFRTSDILSHIFSRTAFCQVSTVYCHYAVDSSGDAVEILLSLA